MAKNKFLKGAILLGGAGLFAKFLGIFFKIPLQKLIQDEGMGLFGLPYPLYSVLLSISLIGLPGALSKMISESIAAGHRGRAQQIFHVAFLTMFLMGLSISIFLFFFSGELIQLLQWPPEAYYSLRGLAWAPFFVSVMSAFRGYFQGRQMMHPTAISQILEQLGRVGVGIGLAYLLLDRGIGYAAGGASFGATAGAFLGALFLTGYYLKVEPIAKTGGLGTLEAPWRIIKGLAWLALPITIGAVLGSIMGVIDSVMVPARLMNSGYTVEGATILYGRLSGKAMTLMNVPLTFSVAMSASLVPTITESYSLHRQQELKEKIIAGMKTTLIIALPATVGLSMLSVEIVHLLWGNQEAGGEILKILAWNVLSISMAQTLTGILQGMNRVLLPVKNMLLGVLVKWVVSYLLLDTYLHIIGAVIGSICGYTVIMLLNYLDLKRLVTFDQSLGKLIISPAIATIFMAFTVRLSVPWLMATFGHENTATIGAISLGALAYFTLLFILEKTLVKWMNT